MHAALHPSDAHVALINGPANQALLLRFRVKGYPTFYVVDGSQRAVHMLRSDTPASFASLLEFARSRGRDGGVRLSGPLSPYWRVVAAVFAGVQWLHDAGSARFRGRPLALVGTVLAGVAAFAVVAIAAIHVATRPPRPRAHAD